MRVSLILVDADGAYWYHPPLGYGGGMPWKIRSVVVWRVGIAWSTKA